MKRTHGVTNEKVPDKTSGNNNFCMQSNTHVDSTILIKQYLSTLETSNTADETEELFATAKLCCISCNEENRSRVIR